MPSSDLPRRTRPVFKTAAYDDQEKFQRLPNATGRYPYHLDIKQVLPGLPENKMVFHMAGDTGGLVLPVYKHRVANAMISQCAENAGSAGKPAFFFHLGDVVYNYGAADEYYPQFFEPYRYYRGPIFAIPGNHDADVDPFDPEGVKSLDAFMNVFCDQAPRPVPFDKNSGRKSNVQPNVYFTLNTPLADIICLYSNVPRFGAISAEQRAWFIDELKTAGKNKAEKALIVCLHHAPYSADTNHGSSMHMQLFLNSAFDEAGVLPNVVFSGHVHNYQRFSKLYPKGKTVPFIVAGAGGYADLHKIVPPGDPDFPDDSPLLDNVHLENYCDHTHGFLKITVEKNKNGLIFSGLYYIVPNNENNIPAPVEFDSFEFAIGNRPAEWKDANIR